MWTYHQSTGKLYKDDVFEAIGYAGTGDGRNNPSMQDVQKVGPLPQGIYTIGKAYAHPKLGPCVMNLEPDENNEMFGRGAFRIHGDNVQHDASEGCMVLGPQFRQLIAASDDKILEVVE